MSDMDGERHDPLDDDITVVGDHELVVELRRIAAERTQAPGRTLPPPRPALGGGQPDSSAPVRGRPGERATAARRDVPPQPRPMVGAEWWDDDEDDGPGRMRLVLIAALVVAVAVVALLILR